MSGADVLRSSSPEEFKQHLAKIGMAVRETPRAAPPEPGCMESCASGINKMLQSLGCPCAFSVGVDKWYNQPFFAKKVRVDGVENDLAYARTGSDVPESLHGIFWMDMFYQSSIAQDPMYENKPWWIKKFYQNEAPSEVAPDLETLVCFGDVPGKWDAEAKTMRDVGYCGEKGHWTFPDTKDGAFQQNSAIMVRMNADLVFQDSGLFEAWVSARIKVPATGMWIEVPRFLFEMLMFQAPHGWSRKTTVGNLPDFIDHSDTLEKLLPPFIMKLLQNGEKGDWWNYPMVRIVDGNGNRTEHYDEYLAFMKRWGSDKQLAAALKV